MATEAFQQDIFQRYSFLTRLLVAAFQQPADRSLVRVLDIGSGPERLTERFLPAYFEVTRADVNGFGDDALVRLEPGRSLPFEDASFAVVIALEVLEHVPAVQRASLIHECARVASRAVVLCCPVASPLTTRAEDVFQALATEMSGSAIAFLEEHRTVGLPEAAAVRAALEQRMPHVADLPNSPLPEWLVYNLIDFAYACDFGDAAEKARFNARVNATTPLSGTGAHYRRFFIACREAERLRRMVASAEELLSSGDDALTSAVTLAKALVQLRRDLQTKHADGMREAVRAKDAHIEALDDLLRQLREDVGRGVGRVETGPATAPAAQHRPPAPDAVRTVLGRGRARLRNFRLARRVPKASKALVDRSGLFDADFYLARNPDVAASGVDPLVHYLSVGATEGRDPNPVFDTAHYLAGNPDVRGSGVNPLVHYITQGAADGRDAHPLFDTRFYLARHPEVAQSGISPLAHYLATGARTRWDPSPLFWSGYYLDTNPDVAAAGINPLAHYSLHGAAEGRNPSPLFDARYYQARHADVVPAGANPLVHYLTQGAAEGYDPHPLFWSAYYLDTNPDVAAAGMNPLVHYVVHGAAEGRNPNPLFDARYYQARYAHVVPAGADALRHYLAQGAADERDPHPLFDTRFYLAHHPEVAHAGISPLAHYLATGGQTRWDPSPLFWAGHYLDTNPDVAAAGMNPLVHYVVHGAAEGRNPNPLFDAAYYHARHADVIPAGADALRHYLAQGAADERDPHPLFDTRFYLAHHPDVAHAGISPLAHYLATGGQTRWDPSPLFWAGYYLDTNPAVAAAGMNPLVHYVVHGAAEGRNPNPLFDARYYQARNADESRAVRNPLVHYVQAGAAEGRKPSALFDTNFYLAKHPDVAASGINPLAHYLQHGRVERRPPNAFFDPVHYLAANPDVDQAGADPLLHFLDHGAAEGRDPSPAFNTSYYLRDNPDVATAGLNPLAHYLDYGLSEGRRAQPPASEPALAVDVAPLQGAQSTREPGRFVPPVGLLPWFNPLNLRVAPTLDDRPSLNVLVPGLAIQHMSGGPNTALHIAYRLAAAGVTVRLISTDAPMSEGDALWAHLQQLSGSDRRLPNIEFADAHDRGSPFYIGRHDLFFATAWWTAQMAKFGAELTSTRRFVYLIQDYEPLLHAASTSQALAAETYSLDFVPIVNSRLLFEFLTRNGVGRFASQDFADTALVFEPAVDRSRFFVEPPAPGRPHRLLFYARPTTGLRNLFELGVAALMDAVQRGLFSGEPWELLAMGEPISPVDLGRGITLKPAPWLDFDGYAAQMRQADVLLSMMLSPHPSYPPLEMAACGGITVTTSYDCKTAERLAAISPNILGAPPTIEGVAEALAKAVRSVKLAGGRTSAAPLDLPSAWDESLAPILPRLHSALLEACGAPRTDRPWNAPDLGPTHIACGFERWPLNGYERFRIDCMHRRATVPEPSSDDTLLSLVTTAWNTEPRFLEYLATSVFQQVGNPSFEWVIVDNGSDRADTRRSLEEIARHPAVRLHRVERNLGIAGGMRLGLDRARRRYILPLDSDDYLYPDCLRLVGSALAAHRFPPLLYTDEDKLSHEGWRDPYFKPGWDPVLFVNSCYVAHLSAIDRRLALELDCYAGSAADGSHDWETFTRFMIAGHVPAHLPEVVYGWRMHEGSTAGNVASKPYVTESQRRVLTRFLEAQPHAERFSLEKSPLFGETPDWWLRRLRVDPRPVTTVVFGNEGAPPQVRPIAMDSGIPHEITSVGGPAALRDLRLIAGECASRNGLVHLLAEGIEVTDPEWAWEAIGLTELFADTVMVGGRLHDGDHILSAGLMFGFGSGCGSPDRGRHVNDPGYFAQMWKPHSVNAVSTQHAVIDAAFLTGALDELEGLSVSLTNLGAWLGARARRAGSRIVYSPFVSARADRDAMAGISDRERAVFRVANADLIPEQRLLSPHLGLSPETAYLPVTEERRRTELEPDRTMLPEYGDWLSGTIAARRYSYPLPPRVPSMSVLTTVYSGTPAALFEQTADSLLRQTHSFFEWIILAHGGISEELDAALGRLEPSPGVRVLRRTHNLGIVGGMRECLLAAQGEYVVPVDADDLLTPDAIQVLASAIGRRKTPPLLVYSDEDVWRDQRPDSPYARADFDPVLNLEASYIWHLCAIRRDAALARGLYTDPAMEYCHDWDSVTRIAGVEDPVHVPEVIYHWRHHAESHTNRNQQHPGSLDSTRHLLERTRAGLASPARYEVGEFPIFRGAREWYLRRRPVEPPPVAVILVCGSQSSARLASDRIVDSAFPFVQVASAEGHCEAAAIVRELGKSGVARYAAVLSTHVVPEGDGWIWEAVRLFECHASLALCGGRLFDENGTTTRSCGVLDDDSMLAHPFVGLGRLDPGPFALALKPHLVATVPDDFCVIATDVLSADAATGAPACGRSLGLRLAAEAWARGRTVAYSPLIEARLNESARPGPVCQDADRHDETLAELRATLGGRRLGAGGLLSLQRRYRS
jgi:glycosyltransferase involved in cell wall biosynthesis